MNAQTPRIARFLVLAVLASAVAVGCSKKVKETPPTDTAPVDTGATTTPIAETPRPGAYSPADLDTDACLRNRVVYFDLDQDALKPEFQAAMACHAKYLRDRPSARHHRRRRHYPGRAPLLQDPDLPVPALPLRLQPGRPAQGRRH